MKHSFYKEVAMLTMALTGHRPQRLKYSRYLETDDWRPIIDWLKQQIKELGVTDAISGMAEGSDCVYALAVIELKDEGYDIKLHCVLPCDNYQCNYYIYNKIKKYADTWTSLSKDFYKGCDNVRDQYMVDNSDKLFAIWDGIEAGGVWSTIRKAQKKGLDIICYPKEWLH